LDQEYEAFQRNIEAQQEAIDNNLQNQLDALDQEYEAYSAQLNSKIDELRNYLNSTGLITQEAMSLLESRTQEFYDQLLEWNRMFGTGVDQDIIQKMMIAFGMLQEYNNALFTTAAMQNSLLGVGGGASGTGGGGGGGVNVVEAYHDGGIVGDMIIGENEEFAKLLRGEVVVTPVDINKFMHSTLPNLVTNNTSNNNAIGDIKIEIAVNGAFDKSVLPDFKNVVLEVLNTAMKDRGIRRNSFSYSI
jgi:hypothetical protein